MKYKIGGIYSYNNNVIIIIEKNIYCILEELKISYSNKNINKYLETVNDIFVDFNFYKDDDKISDGYLGMVNTHILNELREACWMKRTRG